MAHPLPDERGGPHLPDDILREIFLHCMAPSDSPIPPSVTEGSLQLSHVCSNWRAVSHDLGRLWHDLFLRRPYLERAIVEEARLWLQRAGNTPIHFHLSLTSNNPTRILELRACLAYHSQRVADYSLSSAIQQQSDALSGDPPRKQRWEDSLNELLSTTPPAPPSNTLSKILKPVGSSIVRLVLRNVPLSNLVHLPRRIFPALERLVLDISDRVEYQDLDWTTAGPIKAFRDCPSLRYVALCRFFREDNFDFIQLPLRQLSHLVDCGPFYGWVHPFIPIAGMLEMATNLRLLHLSLDDTSRLYMTDSVPASVAYPSLEFLSIENNDPSGIVPDFFATFTFPNLRSLRYPGPASDLEDFFRSGTVSNLEQLLLSPEDNPEDIASYLELLSQRAPQLSSLEIPFRALQDVLLPLSDVDPIRYQPLFLPNLRTLRICCSYASQAIEESQRQRIESNIRSLVRRRLRNENPRCFQSITITDGGSEHAIGEWLFRFFRFCCDAWSLELDITLDRSATPCAAMADSLLADPELAGWSGLQELAAHDRSHRTWENSLAAIH
ncbi:hypothetical protein NMY22_g8050 [Coprinellus aureogranulatus]|nr:hypothetical protein NMY22_g8050 [Coprinellus aureogranulatus]